PSSPTKGETMFPTSIMQTGSSRAEQDGRQSWFHRPLMATVASLGILAVLSGPAMAHCDSMDGPVVQDAQRAIAEENVTPVLKWVTAKDEDEIRSAFEMTLAVRGESDKAQQVAD